MLSQHYRKLNDRAHYFNTLFLLLNHCAIHVPSASRQATSKKKKPCSSPSAVLPGRCLSGCSLRAAEPGCTSCPGTRQSWWPFSKRQLGNRHFSWWGGRKQWREDDQSLSPSREGLPRNVEGLVPLKETIAAIL